LGRNVFFSLLAGGKLNSQFARWLSESLPRFIQWRRYRPLSCSKPPMATAYRKEMTFLP